MKPAPTEARTSRTGRRKPVGAPLRLASWESAETVLLVAVELPAGERGVVHAVGAVDLSGHGLDFLPERGLRRVQVVKAVRLARYLGDRLGDLGRSPAAVGEVPVSYTHLRAH